MLRELRRFEAKSTPRQLDLPLLIRSVRAARGRGRPRLHAPGTVRSRRQDRHHASAADPTLSSTLRWTRTSPSTRLQACRRASAPRTTPPASPERRTPNGSFGHLLFLEPVADAARWRSRDAAQRRGPEQASKVDKVELPSSPHRRQATAVSLWSSTVRGYTPVTASPLHSRSGLFAPVRIRSRTTSIPVSRIFVNQRERS